MVRIDFDTFGGRVSLNTSALDQHLWQHVRGIRAFVALQEDRESLIRYYTI